MSLRVPVVLLFSLCVSLAAAESSSLQYVGYGLSQWWNPRRVAFETSVLAISSPDSAPEFLGSIPLISCSSPTLLPSSSLLIAPCQDTTYHLVSFSLLTNSTRDLVVPSSSERFSKASATAGFVWAATDDEVVRVDLDSGKMTWVPASLGRRYVASLAALGPEEFLWVGKEDEAIRVGNLWDADHGSVRLPEGCKGPRKVVRTKFGNVLLLCEGRVFVGQSETTLETRFDVPGSYSAYDLDQATHTTIFLLAEDDQRRSGILTLDLISGWFSFHPTQGPVIWDLTTGK